MNLNQLPLNSLRAFYASAKHQSFTNAANELFVTQAAVSQQVKTLENRLGVTLFNRMPRGISLTPEGVKLYPVVEKVFLELTVNLDNLKFDCTKELVNIGVVGTFALNWLLPRLNDFYHHYPNIELRISTNNNIADAFSEGLDYFIRFGRGHWHGTEAELLFNTPFTPLCNPSIASRLHHPQDLLGHTLLQSYDVHEWEQWLKQAHLKTNINASQTITFDSTTLMVEAAIKGYGIALAPPQIFHEKISQYQIVQPFNIYLDKGGYWLTRLETKQEKVQHIAFKRWLFKQISS